MNSSSLDWVWEYTFPQQQALFSMNSAMRNHIAEMLMRRAEAPVWDPSKGLFSMLPKSMQSKICLDLLEKLDNVSKDFHVPWDQFESHLLSWMTEMDPNTILEMDGVTKTKKEVLASWRCFSQQNAFSNDLQDKDGVS